VAAFQGAAVEDQRFQLRCGSFSQIASLLDDCGWGQEALYGVLFDLGLSSSQLADPARGFSFDRDGPLDMRYDPSTGISAGEWLDSAAAVEIEQVLRRYGEEPFSRRIARGIVARRSRLRSTRDLARLIDSVVPRRRPGRHPATRSFQAIRIFINRELEEVELALQRSLELLTQGGRLVVISFHSLEDRLVKHFIQSMAALRPLGKAQRPGAEELQANPRSRSAIMRVAERV